MAVTGFTSTVPPPQQCRGRRKGGREVTNKLRTRASAVACAFFCAFKLGFWFFCFFATRCGSFLLAHRDSNKRPRSSNFRIPSFYFLLLYSLACQNLSWNSCWNGRWHGTTYANRDNETFISLLCNTPTHVS